MCLIFERRVGLCLPPTSSAGILLLTGMRSARTIIIKSIIKYKRTQLLLHCAGEQVKPVMWSDAMALRVALLGGSNLTFLTTERQFNPVHYDNDIQLPYQAYIY